MEEVILNYDGEDLTESLVVTLLEERYQLLTFLAKKYPKAIDAFLDAREKGELEE